MKLFVKKMEKERFGKYFKKIQAVEDWKLFSNKLNWCWSDEACWWTIHPASKQRSEGEKVRVGDDVILVSVATERYLVCLLILCKNIITLN